MFFDVAATGTTGPGYIQALPTGRATRGASSSGNFTGRGRTVAAAAIGGIGDNGLVAFCTPTPTHLVTDVLGYLTGPRP